MFILAEDIALNLIDKDRKVRFLQNKQQNFFQDETLKDVTQNCHVQIREYQVLSRAI